MAFGKVPMKLGLLLLVQISIVLSQSTPQKPNIVFIVVDDLGWDDVSFHGSPQIPTPNIDSLAKSGVILNNYYVSPSPYSSKTEFMTGKYASHLGTQHGVLHNKQASGLPEGEKILPEYLQQAGYQTCAVGKWSLGFYNPELLPWNRGFDTFYGSLTSSSSDYFTHSAYDENYGLDLRRNDEVVLNETGNYITDVFTQEAVNIINNYDHQKPLFLYVAHQAVHSGNVDDPLQAPDAYTSKVPHIKDAKRKLYAGMVVALDESVLNITTALSDKGLLENTVIIFTTDAGGAVGGQELSSASNFPLRGSKLTVWEGGVRAVSFVYSDFLQNKGRVSTEMYHSTDWMPTILSLAGADTQDLKTDGFNVWDSINQGQMSPRFEILHQFDPANKNLCGLRVGDYKIVINQDIGFYGDWYPRPAEVGELRNLQAPDTLPNAKVTCDKNYPHPFLEMHAPPCDPMKRPCLFNIQWDPCEFHNLAEFMPNTLKVLLDRLQFYRARVVKPVYPVIDPRADPENSNGVWSPWVNVTLATPAPAVDYSTTPIPYVGGSDGQMSLAPDNSHLLQQFTTTEEYPTTTPPPGVHSLIDQVITPLVFGPMTNSTATNATTELETQPEYTNGQQPPRLIASYDASNSGALQHVVPSYTTPEPYLIAHYPNTQNDWNNATAPQYESLAPTWDGTLDNKSTEGHTTNGKPMKDMLDVESGEGDSVGIRIKNRNATRVSQTEVNDLTEDGVRTGNSATVMDMKGKTTEIYVMQNQSSDNPSQTTTIKDDVNLNKNNTKVATAITEKGISYSASNDVTSQHQDTMVYESEPVNDQPASPAVIIVNATAPNNEVYPTNDTNNVLTGQGAAAEAPPPAVPADKTQPSTVEPAKPISPDEIAAPIEPLAPSKPAAVSEPGKPLLPPAIKHPPSSASLMPDGKQPEAVKPAKQMGLGVGTGSKSYSETESEASSSALTAAKTDSKLPALQNPHVLATLNNLADAGDAGKNGLSSEVAIATGSNLGPNKISVPTAQKFVKQPEYQAIEPPEFEKPQNPFKPNPASKMSAGAKAGAGSETESETVVGAGAKTGSDTKIGPKLAPDAGKPLPERDSKEPAVAKAIAENTLPEVNNAVQPQASSPFVNTNIQPETSATNAQQINEQKPLVDIQNIKDLTSLKPQQPVKEAAAAQPLQPASKEVEELPNTSVKKLSPDSSLKNDLEDILPETKPKIDSFASSPGKGGLGGSLKAINAHSPGGAEFSLVNGASMPNPVSAGYRPFQSVSDVVNDASVDKLCSENRNCISSPPDTLQETGPEAENKTIASQVDGINTTPFGEERAQATSNESVSRLVPENYTTLSALQKNEESLMTLPAKEKLHKFFGSIKVDNKKMFFITGTASEDKALVYSQSDSSGLVTQQGDVKKHNIGFNVVLPSTVVKQLAPKFKERSKVENSTKSHTKMHVLGEKPTAHPKSKAAIKKVFDMVADATTRSRKMKVESPPPVEGEVNNRANIVSINGEESHGMNGDIGATKPLKGTLIESHQMSDDIAKSEIVNTTGDVVVPAKAHANTDAGDLGSIVTLVGKVKVDRLSSKRMKGIHNTTTSDDNAHKKTVLKEHMSVKDMPRHNTSQEINAANINSVQGPSNSIIVSSVIVVLIASFVVVGMAVVAVVAVVARHCRVSKHFDAS